MHKLVLQFIFCMITGQIDKASHNWEIEEHEGYIDLVPLYDNSLSFYKLDKNGEMFVSFNNIEKSMKIVLEEFLSISSQEFVNLFLEKFNLLTEEVLSNVFLEIEKRIGCEISNSIKSEMLYTLTYNRNEINDVLKKLHIENKNGRK